MRALCALLLLAVATPAQAGVVVGSGVPFTAADLEHALAARRPAALALAIDVQAISPDRLRVVGGAGQWEIDLDDAEGAAAARLVALNILGPAIVDDEVDAHPAVPPPGRRVRITATAGAGRGVGGDDLPAVVGAIEATSGHGWLVGAAFEWQESLAAAAAGGEPVDARAWLLRGVIGRAVGPIELAGGPLIGRLEVDGAPVAAVWQSGLALGARAGWPIAPRWSLVVGAGADVYRERIEVQRAGQMVATTPRVAIGASVGLRWELGR